VPRRLQNTPIAAAFSWMGVVIEKGAGSLLGPAGGALCSSEGGVDLGLRSRILVTEMR